MWTGSGEKLLFVERWQPLKYITAPWPIFDQNMNLSWTKCNFDLNHCCYTTWKMGCIETADYEGYSSRHYIDLCNFSDCLDHMTIWQLVEITSRQHILSTWQPRGVKLAQPVSIVGSDPCPYNIDMPYFATSCKLEKQSITVTTQGNHIVIFSWKTKCGKLI